MSNSVATDLDLQRVPIYAAFLSKLDELSTRSAELAAIRRDQARTLETRQPKPVAPPPLRESVRQLLGKLAPEAVAPTTALESPEAVARRLGDEHADIEQAIVTLRARELDIRRKASDELCDRVRPEFQRRAKAVARAAASLADAIAAYTAIVAPLMRSGAFWAQLGALPVADIGRPGDASGPLRALLHDAAQSGFVAPGDIPEGYR